MKSFIKNFVLVTLVSIVAQLILSGPERTYRRFLAMYEKPQATVYPLKCVFGQCLKSTFQCVMNTNCRKTIQCITECTDYQPMDKVAACAYVCEMTHGYENAEFLENMNCLIDGQCLPQYPDDGICYGQDSDGIESITSMDQIKGDWWVVRGLNCGYGDFPGGYDWYPCQHERFIKQDSGQWINNVTYCDGKNNECTSPMIVTVANVSLPAPGVVKHEYTDAPLMPQTERWRILSWPDKGDYLFMLWCGQLPILDYNGGIVLSRKRSDKDMPKKTLKEFQNLAKKFGLSWEEMCPSDNHHCPL